jgi:site-specific DNA-methyltransferase (adenine-specific)
MCSYLAMFPPALPRYFIEQCTRDGDVVLDPFSGRGTAPLEACLSGRIGVGSDLNPLAAILTAAKLLAPSHNEALSRVEELRASYRSSTASRSAPPEIKVLFDGRRTLPQLNYLRSSLSRRRKVDRHLLAVLCGILHGNHPSEPRNARTLSISMPNTFSMSPQYIRRYVRTHGLRKYPFDAFDLLVRRLEHLNRDGSPEASGRALQVDARRVGSLLPRSSVSLIFTSPPYLRVVRYGKFNWIRLWLLGESVDAVDRDLCVESTDKSLRLSDQLRLPAYTAFLRDCVRSWTAALKPGGVCALVIGDVRATDGSEINLAAEVWKAIRRDTPLQLIDIVEDTIDRDGKVTRIWGSTRGEATKTDRILLLKKPGARRRRARSPNIVLENLLNYEINQTPV